MKTMNQKIIHFTSLLILSFVFMMTVQNVVASSVVDQSQKVVSFSLVDNNKLSDSSKRHGTIESSKRKMLPEKFLEKIVSRLPQTSEQQTKIVTFLGGVSLLLLLIILLLYKRRKRE